MHTWTQQILHRLPEWYGIAELRGLVHQCIGTLQQLQIQIRTGLCHIRSEVRRTMGVYGGGGGGCRGGASGRPRPRGRRIRPSMQADYVRRRLVYIRHEMSIYILLLQMFAEVQSLSACPAA